MGADFSLCVQEDLPRKTRWLITNDHPSSPPRCLFQQCVAKCVDYVVAHTARSFGGSELTISVNTRTSSRPLCLHDVTSFSIALSNAFREYNVRFTTVDLSQCANTLAAWDAVTIAKALAAVSYSKTVCGSGGQDGSSSPSPNPTRYESTEDVRWRPGNGSSSTSSASLVGVSWGSIYDTFRRSGEIFVGDGSGLDAEAHWSFSSLKLDNHRSMGIDHLRSIAEAFAPPPPSSYSYASVELSSGSTQAITLSMPPVVTISLQNTSFVASDVTALAWKCASWLVLERGEPCRWAPRIDVEGEFVGAPRDSESKWHETEPSRAASSPRRGQIATSWRQSQVAARPHQSSHSTSRSYSSSSRDGSTSQQNPDPCGSSSASPEPANTAGSKKVSSAPERAGVDEEHDFYARERSVAAPTASYSGRECIRSSTNFVEQEKEQKRSVAHVMQSDFSVSAGNGRLAAALILAAVGEEADGWSPARLGIEHSPPPPTSASYPPSDSFRQPNESSLRQSGEESSQYLHDVPSTRIDKRTTATVDGRVPSSFASAPTRSPSPLGADKGDENAHKNSSSNRNLRGTSHRRKDEADTYHYTDVDPRLVVSPSHSPREVEVDSRYAPLIQSISNRAFALSEFTARRILEWHLEVGQLEAKLSALHDFASSLESTKSEVSGNSSTASFFESIQSDGLDPLKERLAFFKKEELALLSGKAHAWLQVVFSLVEFAEGVAASSSSSRSEPVSDFMEQLTNTGLGDSEVAPLLEVLSCQPKKRELMRSLAVEGNLVELLRNGRMDCRTRSRQNDEDQEEDEWMMVSSGSSSPRAKPMSPMSISMAVLFVGRLLSNFCNSAAERDVLGPFSAAMEGSLAAVHRHCVEYTTEEDDDGGGGVEQEEQKTQRPSHRQPQTVQREVEGFSRSQVTFASRSVSPTPGQRQQAPVSSTSTQMKESLVFSLVETGGTAEEEEEVDARSDHQLEDDEEAPPLRQSRTEEINRISEVKQGNEATYGDDNNRGSGKPRSSSTSRFPHYMKPLGPLGGHGPLAAVIADANETKKDDNVVISEDTRVNAKAINTHESFSSLDDNTCNSVAEVNPPPTLLLRVPPVPPSVGSLLSLGRARSPSPPTSTTALRQQEKEVQPSGNSASVSSFGGSSFGVNLSSSQGHRDYFSLGSQWHEQQEDPLRSAASRGMSVEASYSSHVEGMSKGIPLLPKPFDVEDDNEETIRGGGKTAKKGGGAGLKLLFKKSEGGSAIAGVGGGGGGATETVGSTRANTPNDGNNNNRVTMGSPRMTLAVTARIERLKLQQEKERKARERVDNSKRFANVSPRVSSRRNTPRFSSAHTPTASPRTASPHVRSTNATHRDESDAEDPNDTKKRPAAMRYFVSSSTNIPSDIDNDRSTKVLHSQDTSSSRQLTSGSGSAGGERISKAKSPSGTNNNNNNNSGSGNALLQRALRVNDWNDSVTVPPVPTSERRSALRSTALVNKDIKERSRYGDEHDGSSVVRAVPTRGRKRGGSHSPSRSASRSQHRNEHHHENIVSTVALMRQAHEKARAEAEQTAGEGRYNFVSRGASSSSSLLSINTQHLVSEFEKLSAHVQDALQTSKNSTNERHMSAARGKSPSTGAQAQPQASTKPPPQPQARAAVGVRSRDETSAHKVADLAAAAPKEQLSSPAALASLLFPSSTSYAASPLNVAAPPKRKEADTTGSASKVLLSGGMGGLSYFVSSSSRSSRSPSLMRGGSDAKEGEIKISTKSSGAPLRQQNSNKEAPALPQHPTTSIATTSSFSERQTASSNSSDLHHDVSQAQEEGGGGRSNIALTPAVAATHSPPAQRRSADEPFFNNSGGRSHTFVSDAALRTITNNAVEAGLDRRAARKHSNPAEYFSLRPQLKL